MNVAVNARPGVSLYAVAHLVALLFVLNISNPRRTRNDVRSLEHELERVKAELRLRIPQLKTSQSPLWLDCGGAGEEDQFWAAAVQAIDGLEANTVDDALAAIAVRIQRMRQVDRAIEGWADRIDASRAAVFVAYRCGAYSAGGRLFLLTHVPEGHWRVTDLIELPSGESASVVAHQGERYVLQSSTITARVDVSTLTHVRAVGSSWWRLYIGKNLIGLETRVSKRTVVATWSEESEWFDTPPDGPQLSFEATLRLTSGWMPALVRSTTPWLQGLEDYCDERRRDPTVPCSGRIQGARVVGRVAEVRVSGAGICSPGADCCPADSEVVVELERYRQRFLVVGAHPVGSSRATAR